MALYANHFPGMNNASISKTASENQKVFRNPDASMSRTGNREKNFFPLKKHAKPLNPNTHNSSAR
jgi:hypothetical protein